MNRVSFVVLPFSILVIAHARLIRNEAYEELAIIYGNLVDRLRAHEPKEQR